MLVRRQVDDSVTKCHRTHPSRRDDIGLLRGLAVTSKS
jgi:hypothetical protein